MLIGWTLLEPQCSNNNNNSSRKNKRRSRSRAALRQRQRQPRSARECRAHSRNRALASNRTRGAICLIAPTSTSTLTFVFIIHAYPRAPNVLVACRIQRRLLPACLSVLYPSCAWGDSAQVSSSPRPPCICYCLANKGPVTKGLRILYVFDWPSSKFSLVFLTIQSVINRVQTY